MPLPDFAQGIQYSFLDSANRARLNAHAAANGTAATSSTTSGASAKTADNNDLTFDDLVDIVNPLQHLPVVSTLYRHYAHDPIKPLPKIAGDALYGGWMGLASSVADYAFEKLTGKSFGDTVLALVTGDDGATDGAATSVASVASVASAAAPAAAGSASAASTTTPRTASAAPIPLVATSLASRSPAAALAPQAASTGPSTAPVATNAPPTAAPNAAPAQIPTIDAAAMDAFMTAVNSKGIDSDLGRRTVDAYRRTVGMQAQSAPTTATVH